MRRYNVLIAGLAFLMALIAVYFGSSVYNAKENMLITHLNEMDQLQYYDVKDVPALNRFAAILTTPFLFCIVVGEFFIAFKSKITAVKYIARGLAAAMSALFCFGFFVIADPVFFDFSQWGFFWVLLGITTAGGNIFSALVPGNKSADMKAGA